MATSDIQQPGWHWRIWPWQRTAAADVQLPALAEYRSLKRNRLRNSLGIGALMLFCLIYGFFFSAFVPSYFAFFMLPLAFLGLLVIWVLPDLNWAPTKTLEWLLLATMVALVAWPDYLALSLPGLPWITLLRLTSFPTTLVLLICLSMSTTFREQMVRTVNVIPSISILLAIFAGVQFVSIAFSAEISSSLQKFIIDQVVWTAMFFAGTYVFLRPGMIRRWSLILWALAIYVALISILEYRVGHILWAGHIPSFLKVEDESVERVLAGSMRAGTNRYRAQATFGTPLGLAEYIALALPFVLHFMTKRFPAKMRIAAFCSVPLLLFSVYLTDAKLGTIGCLLDILLYIFVVAFENWRRNKSSLVAASILYACPFGILVVMAAVVLNQRLHVMILGGSSHSFSTDSRLAQYTLGMGKMLEWPFGYGVGQSGTTLGFATEGQSMITVDTYYLTVLLEYGFAGFIAYFGMFLIAAYEGAKRILVSPLVNEDRSFLIPITVSLTSFIVIKSVFSQQDNHPIVFMILGALVALAASQRAAARKALRTARPVAGVQPRLA